MKRLVKRNIDDVAELVVAAWLVASPFLLGYSAEHTATLTVVMVGAVLSFPAQFSLAKPARWQEYFSLTLALFLVISPFLLNFSHLMVATINTIVAGIVLGGFTIAALIQQKRSEREVGLAGHPSI